MAKKTGRPKIEFTDQQWATIEAACKIQCTGEEIAALVGVHYDTIEARVKEAHDCSFSEYIKRHASGGKASLRRMQWEAAKNGNPTMLIWLGKQHLGQSDKQELAGPGGGPLQFQKIVREVIDPK